MSYKDKLDKCLISLDMGEENALFIVMTKDGTICRKGNGNPAAHLETLKGYSDLGHYEAFMMTVDENWFMFSGAFEQTPYTGRICKLLVVFSGSHGEEAGFKCIYGEDSQGPPKEVAQMLINAVKITDGWYDEEREKIVQQSRITPATMPHDVPARWYEFWK